MAGIKLEEDTLLSEAEEFRLIEKEWQDKGGYNSRTANAAICEALAYIYLLVRRVKRSEGRSE